MLNYNISCSDLRLNFIVGTKDLVLRINLMLKIKVIFEHQYIRICVKLKVGGF
jgi:hypothetical protein